MKVKIISGDPENWYENHIGEVFEVYERENRHGEYEVIHKTGSFYIHKDHCEIIKE